MENKTIQDILIDFGAKKITLEQAEKKINLLKDAEAELKGKALIDRLSEMYADVLIPIAETEQDREARRSIKNLVGYFIVKFMKTN